MQLTARYPQAPALRPVARAEALGSLFWLVMLLLWWQGINAVLWRWFGWGSSPFAATPIWDRVTPLVLLFVVGGLLRDTVALVRPQAIRFHAAAGLLLNVVALRALFTLLGASEWVIVTTSHPATVLDVWINGGVWILLLVLAIVFVVSAAHDTRRLGALGTT
jgi:hypothetical protein